MSVPEGVAKLFGGESVAGSSHHGTESARESLPTLPHEDAAVPIQKKTAFGLVADQKDVIARNSIPDRSSFLSEEEGIRWFTILKNRRAGFLPTFQEYDLLIELVKRALQEG